MGSESVSNPLRLVVKFPAAYWTTFPIFIECHAEELRLKSSSAPSPGNGCVGRKDRQAVPQIRSPNFPVFSKLRTPDPRWWLGCGSRNGNETKLAVLSLLLW